MSALGFLKNRIFLILLIIAIAIFVSLYFAPKTFWNKIFSIDQTATAFTTANSGNWNATTTWGLNTDALQLSYPIGLFVSPTNNNIYIADQGNSRVVVLNPDGTASTTYGGSTLYDGQALINPQGIAISSTGYIYVGDPNNHRLVVLNPDGTASTTYTNPDFDYPISVTLANNHIYVGDSDVNKVIVLNMDGTASTTFNGSASTTLGAFRPFGVAVNASGTMYISDYTNNRIVVLNPDGTASTTYDNLDAGYATPGLNRPANISIASTTGYIYIADKNNNRIVVLNPDGTASTTYKNLDAGYSPVGLSTPAGMHLSDDGKIYISDLLNARIVVLNSDGTSLTKFGPNFPISGYALTAGVDYPGIGSNVTLSTGSVTLTQNESVNNLTLATGGTLNLNGFTLNVNGNWTNTGGTLNSGVGGTINLVSTSTQSIMGTSTFENLTKIVSTSSTLLFDTANPTTINGTLNLSGSLNNILSIGPASGPIVPSYVSRIGGAITAGFINPNHVAVSPLTGKIYVSDSYTDRLMVLNSDGSVASTTFAVGSGLYTPYIYDMHVSPLGIVYISYSASTPYIMGINEDGTVATTTFGSGVIPQYNNRFSISSEGKLYVLDKDNDNIKVFNANGSVASSTYAQGSLSTPKHIAVSPITEKIYLTNDGDPYKILVLNGDGTVASSTFASSSGYYFPYASNLRISSSGIIYFAFYTDLNIDGINEDGTVATSTFGAGTISSISRFAISSSTGKIYVPDSANNNLLVLNPDGTLDNRNNGKVPESFAAPRGVINDSSNNLYVSDYHLNSIQKLDSSGDFISYISLDGIGVLNDTNSLAKDSADNIYIQDGSGSRILKFNSSGTLSASSSAISFLDVGMVVDSSDNIYVTAYGPDKIIKMDQNFNVLATTSTYGTTTFGISNSLLALSSDSAFLYVADNNSRLVKLNSSDLSFVSSTNGPVELNFSVISGVAVDNDGNVYVSDKNYHRIVKFDSNLFFMTQWGEYGTGNAQFNNPSQLSIDSDNYLYVVDSGNNRVQKFNLTIPFTPFNINYTGTNPANLAYLSVSGSNNQSSAVFNCYDGCTNVGGNTNWSFGRQPVPPAAVGSVAIFLNNRANQNMGILSEFDIYKLDILKNSTTTEPANTTPIPVPTVKKEIAPTFSRKLDVGSSGKDVKQLQIFLNKLGFEVSSTGLGSYGNETTYFGALTKNALNNFQKVYMKGEIDSAGVEDGGGVFGTYTIDTANKIFPQL